MGLAQKHVDNVRVHYAAEVYRKAQRYVASQFPFFNRSQGRDHMWFFGWDEGACTAPKDIWRGVMLSHWGNTGHPHTGSQSQYGHDIWNRTMGPDIRNPDQPCFDPAKDIVMPAWTTHTSLTSPSIHRFTVGMPLPQAYLVLLACHRRSHALCRRHTLHCCPSTGAPGNCSRSGIWRDPHVLDVWSTGRRGIPCETAPLLGSCFRTLPWTAVVQASRTEDGAILLLREPGL